MRKLVRFFALVLCSGFSLVSVPVIAQNLTPTFLVFDGLGYKNKPDLVRYGLNPVSILYTSQLWHNGANRDQPDDPAIKDLAQKSDPRIPVILDIEHWKLEGDGSQVDDNIKKLVHIVDLIHQENPKLKVGFFGLLPISNPWRELNYAQVSSDPNIKSSANYVKAYRDYQRDNKRLQKLATYVDFVCPVLYTYANLNGATFDNNWQTAALNAINEAKQYGRPIYAFIWPQFNDQKTQNGDRAFLPANFWRGELEFLRKNGADGVIIWGSPTFRKKGWDENDPWWKVTKDFMLKNK